MNAELEQWKCNITSFLYYNSLFLLISSPLGVPFDWKTYHLENTISTFPQIPGPKMKGYISIVWMQEHWLGWQCCLACRQIILTISDMLALPIKCSEWISVEANAASKGDVNAVQDLTCLRINTRSSGIHQNIWLGFDIIMSQGWS